MTLDAGGSAPYVANTGNHLIRAVDLVALEMTTLAGTGARGGLVTDEGPAGEVALNAPWDLETTDIGLLISLAGANQLVALDVPESTVMPFAGSARLGTSGGEADGAEFAAPSGITVDPAGTVYVVDAESSALRSVTPAGSVGYLAGRRRDSLRFWRCGWPWSRGPSPATARGLLR